MKDIKEKLGADDWFLGKGDNKSYKSSYDITGKLIAIYTYKD